MATNKLLSFMKLIGMTFIMTIITLPANAQFLRTSYFMEGTHYRQQLNPALTLFATAYNAQWHYWRCLMRPYV